jgi:tetratricopeptide (TPR) repeat protein
MTEVPHATAERLALQAQRSSARGDYPAAIRQQRQAVEIMDHEVAALNRGSPALADERKESAHVLSDYWGRLGGIYRRDGKIPEGIDAYHHGMQIERQYRLDDSYNLTNWIVLQLLEDPARLTALAGEIDDAIGLVQAQVDGPRRSQWWAWADLGLLCLLGLRPREAQTAYSRLRQTGARPADYKSVLAVLSSLRERFLSSAPGLAAELNDTIEYLKPDSAES